MFYHQKPNILFYLISIFVCLYAPSYSVYSKLPSRSVFLLVCSGVLGEPGSASFVFEHKGVVCIAKSELKSDADPLELAIDVGAEDIIEDSDIDEDLNDEDDTGENGGVKEENREGQQEVGVVSEEEYIRLKCEPTELNSVSKAVKSKGLSLASASLEYLPTSYVSLEKGPYEKAVHLVELLNEHDDVVEVYDNFVVDKNESA